MRDLPCTRDHQAGPISTARHLHHPLSCLGAELEPALSPKGAAIERAILLALLRHPLCRHLWRCSPCRTDHETDKLINAWGEQTAFTGLKQAAIDRKIYSSSTRRTARPQTFHARSQFLRGLCGPVGSITFDAKLSAFQFAQGKAPDGRRKSRWAIVRNTIEDAVRVELDPQ